MAWGSDIDGFGATLAPFYIFIFFLFLEGGSWGSGFMKEGTRIT